jgi:hypothetical protein
MALRAGARRPQARCIRPSPITFSPRTFTRRALQGELTFRFEGLTDAVKSGSRTTTLHLPWHRRVVVQMARRR